MTCLWPLGCSTPTRKTFCHDHWQSLRDVSLLRHVHLLRQRGGDLTEALWKVQLAYGEHLAHLIKLKILKP